MLACLGLDSSHPDLLAESDCGEDFVMQKMNHAFHLLGQFLVPILVDVAAIVSDPHR